MSYLFRDQRVINELERPKSSDFNIAQSLQTRNLAAAVQGIYSNGAVWSRGAGNFKGFDGPRSMEVTKSLTFIRAVNMSAGMALGYGAEQEDIGDISGVSNYGTSRLAVLSRTRTLAIPDGPATADECRVDVIAIKPMGYLAEYIATDIFNPTTQSFGAPASKPKTYRWDLYDATMQVLSFDGISGATSPLIYIKGAVSSYSDADSFLTADIPNLPPDYIAVAALNIRGGPLYYTLPVDCVRDLRYIVSPGGNRNQLYITTQCGSKTNAAEQQGFVASYSGTNGGDTLPRFLVRNHNDTLTNYQYFNVCIFTNYASSFKARVSGAPLFPDLANLLSQQAQVLPVGAFPATVTSAFKAALASSDVTPNAPVIESLAIGQKFIAAQFALVKSQADTINGTITLTGQAINFGKYDLTNFILTPSLRLTVDWYPFSYDD